MIWNYLNSPPRKQGTTDREKIRMEKMMKKIFIILIVIIAGLMFADIVTFSEGSDASADNIQGKVYIWDDEIEE